MRGAFHNGPSQLTFKDSNLKYIFLFKKTRFAKKNKIFYLF